MLDFQKDSNNFDNLSQEQDSNGCENLNDQYSQETEYSNQNNEYLTTSVQNSSIKRSTVILCAVFAVAGGAIFFMIKKGAPQSASAATPQGVVSEIDLAIAKLSGMKAEIFNQIDGIAKKFDEFSNFQQIPVDQLKINPFKSKAYGFTNAKSDSSEYSTSYTGSLKLDSIMQSGNESFCMIDDKILFIGDTIGGYKVIQIGKDFVNLDNGYETKTLKINMP
jgi:hypothetical protein